MRYTGKILLAVGAAGMMAAGSATPSNAAYYDGKTITFIIGASAGGGLTRAGRMFGRHMDDHIAGKPNIIIKNLTGAGGNKARNFVYSKARPDGLTLHWGTMNPLGPLLKAKGARYDPAKFILIGAGDTTYFTLARTDTGKGLKKATQLMTAGGLIVGGRAPTTNLDLYSRAPLKMLGLKHRYVPGYRGQAKMSPALLSKEINMLTTGNGGYGGFYQNTILKDGTAVGLFYHTAIDENGKAKRYPGLYGDAVHFLDFYKTVKGTDPSGPMWEAYKWISKFGIWPFMLVAPPGTPDEAVADLRKAFVATGKDPKFIADYKKSVGPVPNWASAKNSQWLMTDYKKVSAMTLKGLKEVTSVPGGRKKKKK